MKRTQMTVRCVSESQRATTGSCQSNSFGGIRWRTRRQSLESGLCKAGWHNPSRHESTESTARGREAVQLRPRRQGEDVEDLAAKAEEQHLDADVEVPTHKSWRVEDVAGDAADAALGQMSSFAQSKRCSRKSKRHSDHLAWSKISTTTRCETTAILNPSKFASCATMLGPHLGFRSGFDNCKTQWNNVGPQSRGLQSGTTTSAEARVARASCRKSTERRLLFLVEDVRETSRNQQVENPEN